MKKEWLNAIGAFVSFAISFELVRRLIDDLIMEGIFKDKIISNINGGFIIALEMGLISVLAIACSNIALKQNISKMINIVWKVLLIAIVIGFIVGVTYTKATQSFYCGFVK